MGISGGGSFQSTLFVSALVAPTLPKEFVLSLRDCPKKCRRGPTELSRTGDQAAWEVALLPLGGTGLFEGLSKLATTLLRLC